MLDADLGAAMARYNQVLDVSRDDLKTLLVKAQLRAYERKLTQLRCEDIMSRDLVTVAFDTPPAASMGAVARAPPQGPSGGGQALSHRRHHHMADFMRAAEPDVYDGLGDKLRKLVRTTAGVFSSKPEGVGQIMTRNVRVASRGRYLVELLPLFGSTGHHHLPIIGEGERLVGWVKPFTCHGFMNYSGVWWMFGKREMLTDPWQPAL